MIGSAEHHNILAALEAEIADAEMYLAQALERLANTREMRQSTHDLERWVRDCGFALENLWAVRQQHLHPVTAGVA
jgi:hypothetical protein